MRRVSAVLVLSLLLACGGGSSNKAAPSGDSLVGLFRVTTGACNSSSPTGSWFRMVQPGGTPAAGPFVANPDSTCSDNTVTPLSAGDDGGLRTGSFQPQPKIVHPQAFFAVAFDVSTNEKDPQSGTAVKAPSITHAGSTLQGDLSAISVLWNQQQFNQGAPKPGSTVDGPKGTYDERAHTYTLDWTSRIEGGPFNGFTGMWHLEGTFEPT